jgi:hypothetical protein
MSGSKKAQTHADTRLTLDTCRQMHTRAQLLIRSALQTHAQLLTQETESRYTLRSRNMPTYAQLSSHMQTNAQLSIQGNEWRYTIISRHEPTTHMQIPAQLLTQADTCRNLASLGYFHTRTGLQYMHVHAYFQYMQMHTVTHSQRMQNISCEIRESQYGWGLRGET